MNITKESTGDLTATIKIEVAPEDYNDKVTEALKDIQRKATMKGFRPGKVPYGIINKMYRKGAMAEEVNKLLSESLNNYLVENKLDILGYPLGSKDKKSIADFDNSDSFEFYFDIGLTPQIDLELNDKIEAEYYDIEVEDEKVDNYLNEVRMRYGNPVNPETAEKDDLIRGEIRQLDKDGNILEHGVKNNTSLSINFIKDETVQNQFIGAKKDDRVRFNPLNATGNESETASLLGIKKEEREKLESDYEFQITEISRIEPAEVNKEFFDKVYPKDNIESEEAFRERLRSEAREYFQKESDSFFTHEMIEKIVNETEVNLPDEFVKRWLVESESKITAETIEQDYNNYVKALKQQLIINKIANDHNIRVDRNDVKNHIIEMYGRQFMIDLQDEEKSKQLDFLAESVMKNEEETRKLSDQLFDERIRELFKAKLRLKKIVLSYDQFIEKVNDHHHKHHHHEHE
jgi:trigger factor